MSIQNSQPSGGGCLNGIVRLVLFPIGLIVNLIGSIIKPETRRSSLVMLGAIIGGCLALYGGASFLGSFAPSTTATPFPTNTVLVLTDTPPASQTAAFTSTMSYPTVSLQDYVRVASSRFQTLQEATIEMANIHGQFTADLALSQNTDWYAHAVSTMLRLVTGAHELASMNNYPPEYGEFHQNAQRLSNEALLLETNYTAALDNQDIGALNQATTHLGNVITFMNLGSSELTRLSVTNTPAPTASSLPTATIIYVVPTLAPSNCHPSYPDVCIPYPPPDLDCGDIPYRRFRITGPDVHNFDGSDGDGIGCES